MPELQPTLALYRPLQALSRLRERFMDSEARERQIIQGLPPVFIRLFGDIDAIEQLREVPERFRDKIVVLTTSDTPDHVIASLHSQNWKLIRSEVTTEQARVNSSVLLNEGLKFARENNQSYAFFLSSGFQRHLDKFYGMFYEAAKRHPNQDAYYFILPETHANVSLNSHEKINTEDVDTFLLEAFPYETALFVSSQMPDFETGLSAKGSLGKTSEGVPLGGMEFFLTVLDTYKKAQESGKSFSPTMIGITLPILTRAGKQLIDFYRRTHELPISMLDSIKLAPSLEVTSTDDKTIRRVATWRAAMEKLGLNDRDIHNLSLNIKFESGIRDAFGFTHDDSPII